MALSDDQRATCEELLKSGHFDQVLELCRALGTGIIAPDRDLRTLRLLPGDLRDAVLPRAQLWEQDLRGFDLSGADLSGAMLYRADLRGASLRGALLAQASLNGVRLEGADLRGAVVEGAGFRHAIYDEQTRWPAGVDHTCLRALGPGSELSGVALRYEALGPVRLSGVCFRRADLEHTDLSGADLRDVDFTDADVSGTVFEGACLDGATFTGCLFDKATRWPDGFDALRVGALGPGAILVGADLRAYTRLPRLRMAGADLRRVDLRGARAHWMFLPRADLRQAKLSGADLHGGDFCRADLREADLSGANLRLADLRGADLRGACLAGANLGRAHLQGANLEGVDLTAASGVDHSEM